MYKEGPIQVPEVHTSLTSDTGIKKRKHSDQINKVFSFWYMVLLMMWCGNGFYILRTKWIRINNHNILNNLDMLMLQERDWSLINVKKKKEAWNHTFDTLISELLVGGLQTGRGRAAFNIAGFEPVRAHLFTITHLHRYTLIARDPHYTSGWNDTGKCVTYINTGIFTNYYSPIWGHFIHRLLWLYWLLLCILGQQFEKPTDDRQCSYST